jgi:threonine/homoserine/homoserine lactone efflux protein
MLSWPVLTAFAIVFALAAASPGPAVAAVLARVLARGSSGMVWFVLGLMLGDILWLSAAVFGLAALAALFQPLFLVLKYLGAAYLLYLAWKLWHAPAIAASAEPVRGQGAKLLGGGLLLTMGNPKTMLFYLALLPTLIDLQNLTAVGFLEIALTVVVIFAIVFAGYVVLAAQARRAFTSPRAVRIVNRTSGVAMAGVAAVVAVRQ